MCLIPLRNIHRILYYTFTPYYRVSFVSNLVIWASDRISSSNIPKPKDIGTSLNGDCQTYRPREWKLQPVGCILQPQFFIKCTCIQHECQHLPSRFHRNNRLQQKICFWLTNTAVEATKISLFTQRCSNSLTRKISVCVMGMNPVVCGKYNHVETTSQIYDIIFVDVTK